MSGRDLIAGELMAQEIGASGEHAGPPVAGVVIGQLIGMADGGRTALVLYPGQVGSAAIRARTVVDLRAHQVGSDVVLMFAAGDPAQPIIMGLLRESEGWPLDEPPGQVEVDADGERMIVSAKEEVVLRCGKASITLTRAGKVLIRGSYILSRSSGANQVKGGSVHLN